MVAFDQVGVVVGLTPLVRDFSQYRWPIGSQLSAWSFGVGAMNIRAKITRSELG